MFKYFFYVLLLFASATTTQCTKTSTTPTDSNSLPAATQSGANTFGCLVNGKPFVGRSPDRFAQNSSNWYYDDNLSGGEFHIYCLRNFQGIGSKDDGCGFTIDSVNFRRIMITVKSQEQLMLGYIDHNTKDGKCASFGTEIVFIDTTKTFYRNGRCTISRLDKKARIISGTFNCTIYENGCDTFKITDGRFDISF